MPRQLLRDGRIVADDWTYLTEAAGADAGNARPVRPTFLGSAHPIERPHPDFRSMAVR